jgi:hypothetical protein
MVLGVLLLRLFNHRFILRNSSDTATENGLHRLTLICLMSVAGFFCFYLSDFGGKIGKQEKRGISVLRSTTKDEMA